MAWWCGIVAWWPAEAAAMFEYKFAAAPGLVQYDVADGKMLPDVEGDMPAPAWTAAAKLRCLAADPGWGYPRGAWCMENKSADWYDADWYDIAALYADGSVAVGWVAWAKP